MTRCFSQWYVNTMPTQRKFPLKAGIFFKYVAYKNGKITRKHTSPRKIAFYTKATHAWDVERPDKMYLRVNYNKGNYNDGYYTTKKEWTFAYKAFSEQSLIESLMI